MYCKNCGNQMEDVAAICVKCGVAKGHGEGFCPFCGAAVQPGAAACLKCGTAIHTIPEESELKSRLTAGLLGIFLGGFGVHNFYLGYTGKGIAQILLTFCFGIGAIWGLIEGILILVGTIDKDADGNPLKKDV